MSWNVVTRISAMGLLAAGPLMANTAQAKAMVNKPSEPAKITVSSFASNTAALTNNLFVPTNDAQKAPTPVSSAVFIPNDGGSHGVVQLASWYDPFISWLRNVLASAANGLRAGSRSVREWMQRVADWSRNNIGGSSWVNVKGNGDCDAYVVPNGPVWGICHGHVNGSFDIEIHTK